MNRRNFVSGAITTIASLFVARFTKAASHTDLLRFNMNSDFSFRNDYIPYFNGKVTRGVVNADTVDGWIDVWNTSKFSLERLYGRVQLLNATPEQKREFATTRTSRVISR